MESESLLAVALQVCLLADCLIAVYTAIRLGKLLGRTRPFLRLPHLQSCLCNLVLVPPPSINWTGSPNMDTVESLIAERKTANQDYPGCELGTISFAACQTRSFAR